LYYIDNEVAILFSEVVKEQDDTIVIIKVDWLLIKCWIWTKNHA
jgi:hypothetical protein